MEPTVVNRLKSAAVLLLIALAALLAYTTLHEGGHALAGMVFGGKISDFNVNFFNISAPHVNIDGTFSHFQDAVINVSGAGLPLLIWAILLLFLPKREGLLLQWIKIIITMGTLNTLLAWVVLPFLYLNGTAPAYDDVTKFIANSGLPPLAVAFGALGLYAAGWLLFALRIGSLRLTLGLLRPNGTLPPLSKRLALAGILVAALVGGFALVAKTLNGSASDAPPKGYLLVASIPLSEREYQSEIITQFDARSGQLVGVFVRVKNIDTAYIDVTLIGVDGQSFPLLHGEGFSVEASTSGGEYGLADGEAQIILTSQVSPGLLEIYLRLP